MTLFSESLVSTMAEDVERFQEEVLNFPIPSKPRLLTGELYEAKLKHMNEELFEFQTAHSIEDQADGLIDLVYVALGALIQMGICPRAGFSEVHKANMAKHLGSVAHRPKTAGKDAQKPVGWSPPNLAKILSITMVDIDWMVENQVRQVDIAGATFSEPAEVVSIRDIRPSGPRMTGGNRHQPLPETDDDAGPRILVIGHARHGKDTVSELLRDQYGFSFTSSSMFCAEKVMMPHFESIGVVYSTVEECFRDRGNNRSEWYEAIRDFNTPDLTALGRAIFTEHDVYCGLRHHSEFHALKNTGVFDVCIWVDAQDRQPPEDRSSCSVEPWMADFVLDNNGTLNDLENNLEALMATMIGPWNDV